MHSDLYPDDLDSVTNDLRDSAKGSNDGYDATFSLTIENILLKHGWEKIPYWECLFVHREKGLFLSVYVDDIKIGWKETKS